MSNTNAVMSNFTPAEPETLQFHNEAFVFDALSISYVLEEKYLERVLEAGVNATNVTFALEEDWDTVLRNVEDYLTAIDKSPDMMLCLTADDMLSAQKAGKLGVVFGTQGATMLEEKIWRLDILFRLGLRVLGLSYTSANSFGDGCGERRDAGVSYLGQELIEKVNEMPIMLDLSHCGHQTRAEATKLARAPVCTHSNSDKLRSNGRNTTDQTALAMAAKGGMVGVCGLPQSLADKTPTLDDFLDHVDHYSQLLGDEFVGIGVDYVEKFQEQNTVIASPSVVTWRTRRPDIFGPLSAFGRQSYPVGIETVSKLPNFTQGLLDRGYSREKTKGILGRNWLECFRRLCS